MSKDKNKDKFNFDTGWYELWMKQSREFYDSAEKNLKEMFAPGASANPEENMKLVNQWLDSLKQQWQSAQLGEQQKAFENYWKMMMKMCMDATDMLVQQWTQRARENQPVKSVRELYDLWLNCCNEVYSKSMHSKSYQEAYGEFMNAAIHFWKSALPK
jgi:hypothetical protein